ncbi:MAG: ATP-binding protein [Promethearchaeota archaeon]
MIYINEERSRIVQGIKKREIELKIETDLINDIVGPRRSGKTTLMRLTMQKLFETVDKKRIFYMNFENRKIFPLTPEYFNDLIQLIYEEGSLELGKVYLFLDEVQRIKNWEKYVRSIYDEFKGKVKIFISGSSSKLTRSNLSYLLSGRHLTTVVFPLNFREYLHFNNISFSKPFTEKKQAVIKKALIEYLKYGGFPEAVLTKDDELISTLFFDIINRDIAPRVRNAEILEEFAYFMCTNSSKLTSFSKLSKVLKSRGLKISVPTIEKYFNLMKESFLFFDLTIFSYKIKDQLQYPRKIYCIDTGFVRTIGFRFSEDAGHLMENCVAVQLYRVSQKQVKTKIHYFKDRAGREVDFVIRDGEKIIELIQVCYDINNPETKAREIKALIIVAKELRCENLTVITWDYEGEENGIRFISLWKWLVEFDIQGNGAIE